ISPLKQGRALNILVAEHVMRRRVVNDEIFGDLEIYYDQSGNTLFQQLFPYSEGLAAAKKVINKMSNAGYAESAYWEYETPEVICRASLRIVLRERKAMEKKERLRRFRVIK
nr:hypothetical protein [Desulfobacterales bacterium]